MRVAAGRANLAIAMMVMVMPVMMVTAVRMTMVVNRCGRQRDGLPAWHELRHQQPEAE